jgi:hypothetical protein
MSITVENHLNQFSTNIRYKSPETAIYVHLKGCPIEPGTHINPGETKLDTRKNQNPVNTFSQNIAGLLKIWSF